MSDDDNDAVVKLRAELDDGIRCDRCGAPFSKDDKREAWRGRRRRHIPVCPKRATD